MDQATFKALCEKTVRDTSAILVSKGEEYAGSADRLANFKRGASLTGATALQVAFVYASKHYDSIATFIKKDAQGFEQRLSEPIEGRFDDLINYCILMKALVIEQAEQVALAKQSAIGSVVAGAMEPISQEEFDLIKKGIRHEEVTKSNPLNNPYPQESIKAKFNRPN